MIGGPGGSIRAHGVRLMLSKAQKSANARAPDSAWGVVDLPRSVEMDVALRMHMIRGRRCSARINDRLTRTGAGSGESGIGAKLRPACFADGNSKGFQTGVAGILRRLYWPTRTGDRLHSLGAYESAVVRS